MRLSPTNVPLTVKSFDKQSCGLCAGCGCSCGYVLYTKGDHIVDLYGHPADPNGVGSLCTKGITYIQALDTNQLRLRRAYLKEGESYREISIEEALIVAKEKLIGKRLAFLLDRSAGLEEYILASKMTDLVFSDAPYVPFRASSLRPQDWKDRRFILSIEADPVFSEVMSARWIVDAVEKGSYLYVMSSKFGTVCAKAKESHLLSPYDMVRLLEGTLDVESNDPHARSLRRSLQLIKPSLVLIGSCMIASPFKSKILKFLKEARTKFRIDYALVGDIMPFPSKGIKELCDALDEFDGLVVFGNALRFLKDEHLEKLKNKFVLHFTLFPNFTAHCAHLVLPTRNFTERDFINYRHGFGFLTYSPKTLSRDGYVNPYEFLSKVFNTDVNLREFLKSYGVDYEELKREGIQDLKLPTVENLPLSYEDGAFKNGIYIYTDSGLVEELGHWHTWTHDMEKYQVAYINEKTAKELGLKGSLPINGCEFRLNVTPNVAEHVIFISSSYEEYQPFDPGVSVGRFLKQPYYRFEVLE